jgi:hypothetical protein
MSGSTMPGTGTDASLGRALARDEKKPLFPNAGEVNIPDTRLAAGADRAPEKQLEKTHAWQRLADFAERRLTEILLSICSPMPFSGEQAIAEIPDFIGAPVRIKLRTPMCLRFKYKFRRFVGPSLV